MNFSIFTPNTNSCAFILANRIKFKKFVQFQTVKNITLNQSEFEFQLYSVGRLSFRGRPLLTELEYEQRYGRLISEPFKTIFNRHSAECQQCQFFRESGSIRKREKLTETEARSLAKDIGQCYTNKMLTFSSIDEVVVVVSPARTPTAPPDSLASLPSKSNAFVNSSTSDR